MTFRRRTLNHAKWLALGAACLVPIACGGSSECDGPGGLCLSPPGAAGMKAQGGRGGSSGGSEGGDAGEQSNVGGSANGGKGGSSGSGGSSGTSGGLGRGGSGSGGAMNFGGSVTAGAPGMAGGPSGGGPTGLTCPPEDAFMPNCVPDAGGAGGQGTGWCEVEVAQGGQGGDPGLSDGGEGGVAPLNLGGFAGSQATGGKAGGFGGTATGGTGGMPMPGGFNGTLFPIDDLEDGDELTLPILGGRGVWFVSNDGSGQQQPAPCILPSYRDNGTGYFEHVMRTFGRFFSLKPGGWAQVGISMRSGAPACTDAIDASAMTGVRFRASGNGAIRFMVTTSAVVPPDQDGTCLENCFNSHGAVLFLDSTEREYFFRFTDLSQEPWGTPVTFEPAEVRGLIWNARSSQNTADPVECFDFWIDDVAFFKD